jgi:hypothetical protein
MTCKESPTKGKYATKRIAWIMALERYKQWFTLHSPYKCKSCGYYHLTTRQMGIIPEDMLPAFEAVGRKWDNYIRAKQKKSSRKKEPTAVRPSRWTFWWLKVRNKWHI